jgi:hypothetical protein
MAIEDQTPQKKQKGERLVTGKNWIVCSLIALFLAFGNAKNYPGAGLDYLFGTFIGTLVFVVLIWVAVRGVYRLITRKRPIA